MTNQTESIDALLEIRKMMSQSSRFISLSGLSGIGAGLVAILGAFAANYSIHLANYTNYDGNTPTSITDNQLVQRLFLLAIITIILAVAVALFFTWKKAKKSNSPMWNIASKKMVINLAIPLFAGGILLLKLIQLDQMGLITPICLIFYGLGLINASKFTYGEIKYLGYCELILGLINLGIIGYGMYFWTFGFGILHIIYGILMWNKYDKIATKKA
ncbi:hypothetical protein [Rhizosphaericola mali]|uniref:Uncharacterized protein n=1 Tax=Rhizosphaericola mali TaxID=2545455 RepID=A0A5P2G3W5_9BACT|nr:hypothetical protein [Rhizosphaericola mali]QES89428.1 hypothetical protein E0W69_012390 [Rhizosphaericola mali]